MWAYILVYSHVSTGPVVEQCITERATLYKYIWNKKYKYKDENGHVYQT